jgi:sugar-specific transcriptional regulator TrmB
MPSEDVESALKELMREGFVKIEGNKFSLVNPREAFSGFLRRKEGKLISELEELRRNVASLRKMAEPLYAETRMGIQAEEVLESLGSLSEMETKTVQIISKAEREVLIFTGRFEWFDKTAEVLSERIEKGVEVRVLMRVVDDSVLKLARTLQDRGIEVRDVVEETIPPIRGTLVDERELVFLIWVRKDVKKPIYYRPCYTRNQGLIRVFRDAFEARWRKARTL